MTLMFLQSVIFGHTSVENVSLSARGNAVSPPFSGSFRYSKTVASLQYSNNKVINLFDFFWTQRIFFKKLKVMVTKFCNYTSLVSVC